MQRYVKLAHYRDNRLKSMLETYGIVFLTIQNRIEKQLRLLLMSQDVRNDTTI